MDIEELKRLESEALATNGTVHEGPEWVKFTHALGMVFPAIVARLEAAQRVRDALKILHDENMDYIKLNNLGAENNQSLRMAREALAAFDKEAV